MSELTLQVNPLLEELFWRIFLAHGFDHRAASHFLPANAAPRAVQKWTRGTRGTAALCGLRRRPDTLSTVFINYLS